MITLKTQSAGGKATAIIQKQQAIKRIDEYNLNPNLCKTCGKPLLAKYGQKLYDVKRKKFCSHTCSTTFNNALRPPNMIKYPNKLDMHTDEEIIDFYTNATSLQIFLQQIGYTGRYTFSTIPQPCIRRCQQIGLDLNVFEIHYKDYSSITKGELFNKYTYSQARSKITKMARLRYQNSKKPKKCVVCNYEHHYEVAHIKAVSDFDNDDTIAEINKLDNLIALCPNHHWEYDHKLINIQQYI